MASTTSLLRTGSCLVRSMTTLNRPILMSHTKSLSALTKMSLPMNNIVPRLSVVSSRSMATKGDQELTKFLAQEIQTEKKNSRALPKLDGWQVKTEGSEVTLTRDVGGGEQVVITLNVNHTVDSVQPDDGSEEAPEMMSQPAFEVDLIKPGGKTLSFTCNYLNPQENPEGGEEGMDDLFEISEVTMFEGDNHGDECYAVAGDILDGYLYDLLMTMLEERGVDNGFAERLSEWCSAYEHSRYVSLLEDMDKWTKL